MNQFVNADNLDTLRIEVIGESRAVRATGSQWLQFREDAIALFAACKKLMDAPHQEHFVTRLNEEEMAGIDAIKSYLAKVANCEV